MVNLPPVVGAIFFDPPPPGCRAHAGILTLTQSPNRDRSRVFVNVNVRLARDVHPDGGTKGPQRGDEGDDGARTDDGEERASRFGQEGFKKAGGRGGGEGGGGGPGRAGHALRPRGEDMVRGSASGGAGLEVKNL